LLADDAWSENIARHERRISEQAAVLIKTGNEALFAPPFIKEDSYSLVTLRPENYSTTVGKRKVSPLREIMIPTNYLNYRVAQVALSQIGR
jgi:hypothetical protein